MKSWGAHLAVVFVVLVPVLVVAVAVVGSELLGLPIYVAFARVRTFFPRMLKFASVTRQVPLDSD